MMHRSDTLLYDCCVSGSLRILTDQGYHAGAELTLRTQSGGYLSVSHFEPYLFDESAGIGFGNIYLRLEEIVSMHRFAYTALNGFDFAIDLNVRDRKSTRLNSSHVAISYAVFCLKK